MYYTRGRKHKGRRLIALRSFPVVTLVQVYRSDVVLRVASLALGALAVSLREVVHKRSARKHMTALYQNSVLPEVLINRTPKRLAHSEGGQILSRRPRTSAAVHTTRRRRGSASKFRNLALEA